MPSIWSKLGERPAPSMRRAPRYKGQRSPEALDVQALDPNAPDQMQISVNPGAGPLQSDAPGDFPAKRNEIAPTTIQLGGPELSIGIPDTTGRLHSNDGTDSAGVTNELQPIEIQLEKRAPAVAATTIPLRKKLTPAQVRERSQVLYSLMHKAIRSDTIGSLPADKTIDDAELGTWLAGKAAPSKTIVPFARMGPSFREALGKAGKAEGLKGDAYGWDLSQLTPKEQAVLQSTMRDEYAAAQKRRAEAAQQLYAGDPIVRE